MGKKQDKPAVAAGEGSEAPKKRSKVKLLVLTLAPLLVLAGGGYVGWTMFMGGAGEDAAHASEGDAHGEAAAEPAHVPLPPEFAAETSFTYSFALSELMKARCGKMEVAGLKGASDTEARADGMLVSLSWIAANRRAGTLTELSCNYVVAEIGIAEAKANALAQALAAPAEAETAHH